VEILVHNGLTVKNACKIVGISRSRYYALKKQKTENKIIKKTMDAELIDKIKEIKEHHPFWGYRRIHAWLLHREKIEIGKKKVLSIMREHNLLVKQVIHKAKRVPQRSKPKADRPNQYWGIDMTKFLVSSVGWVYLVIVLDWYTKKIVGWDLSLRSRSLEWKKALDMAIVREFPTGVRGKGLRLISDNGSQPTSSSFMNDMVTLGIEQIFTSYDNPKGNADTERMMRTIKEEVIWLNEFSSYDEAKRTIESWIEEDYNKKYIHSVLGYKSPIEFEEAYYKEHFKEAA